MTELAEVDYDPASVFIGGTWWDASGENRLQLTNPTSAEHLGTVPDSGRDVIDQAVRSARSAFDGPWGSTSYVERAAGLRRLADALAALGETTASLVTQELGQPAAFSREKNALRPVELARYYADIAESHEAFTPRPRVGSAGTTLVGLQPRGVAGLIVPWNYPQSLALAKLAPALAAGCTVVIKPAPETSLDAFLLARAVQAADLPPGVVNIVTGGATAGSALVEHPDVDIISFTGSTPVGRSIAETSGRLLRPAVLELGGKSAAIVLDDADLGVLAAALPRLSFANAGQTCHVHARLVVPRALRSAIEEIAVDVARGFVLGSPDDPRTTLGPVVSAGARTRILERVDGASSSGARLLTGGRATAGLPGYFVEPTVLTRVDPGSPVAQEEIFGPVLTIIEAADTDDAIAIANGTRYGLGSTVFSTDPARATAVAKRVRAGAIGVNGFRPDLGAPFGGVGDSGIGREYGPESIAEYAYTKSIFLS